MMNSPEDGETTSASESLAREGGEESRLVAPHDDPERTVVVPRRHSHDDEEPTVVVPNPQQLVDDPERTMVAPPSLEPRRSEDADVADDSRRGRPFQAASDGQYGQRGNWQPTPNRGASPPSGPPPTAAPPQHPSPALAPGYPTAAPQNTSAPGIPQPGFVPQPLHYGPASQYSFPPPGPYAAAPYGPVAPAGPRRPQRSKALLWGGLGLAGALLATGVAIGLSKPSFLTTKKLDIGAAEAEVQRVLTDEVAGYGDKNVSDVKCNDGANVPVTQGASFTCRVSVDGTPRQVTVTFLDNNGNYEVGRPD